MRNLFILLFLIVFVMLNVVLFLFMAIFLLCYSGSQTYNFGEKRDRSFFFFFKGFILVPHNIQ